MANFEQALAKTLAHEGGFYHAPKTGEVAYKGITLWTLRKLGWPKTNPLPKAPPSPEEIEIVKSLTDAQIAEIYKGQYWYQNQINYIKDQALAEKVFDLAVNTGGQQAGRLLQRAINRLIWPEHIDEDGIIGPTTTRRADECDAKDLLDRLRKEAEGFYKDLASRRPELAENLNGWLKRVNS